jgi:hypothetical protein
MHDDDQLNGALKQAGAEMVKAIFGSVSGIRSMIPNYPANDLIVQ